MSAGCQGLACWTVCPGAVRSWIVIGSPGACWLLCALTSTTGIILPFEFPGDLGVPRGVVLAWACCSLLLPWSLNTQSFPSEHFPHFHILQSPGCQNVHLCQALHRPVFSPLTNRAKSSRRWLASCRCRGWVRCALWSPWLESSPIVVPITICFNTTWFSTSIAGARLLAFSFGFAFSSFSSFLSFSLPLVFLFCPLRVCLYLFLSICPCLHLYLSVVLCLSIFLFLSFAFTFAFCSSHMGRHDIGMLPWTIWSVASSCEEFCFTASCS